MNAFSGTGARLILSSGAVYTADFTQQAGTTKFLTIEGSALGDGSASAGAVLELTGVNGANVNPLQYVTFRRLTFTAPTLAATAAWLNGSSNLHLLFEDCDFIDFCPSILSLNGVTILGAGLAFTTTIPLMLGDVLVLTYSGTGAAAPTLKVTPAAGTW